MRRVFLIFLLALSLKEFAQSEMSFGYLENIDPEVPLGSIAGQITTIDRKPAGYVSVILKGTNKYSLTDENGNFTIKNIKEAAIHSRFQW